MSEENAESTEVGTVESSPVQVDTAVPATLSASDADKIQREEFDRLQRRSMGEEAEKPKAIDPDAKPADEEKPRGPDGKFLPKEESPKPEKPAEVKAETPKATVQAATPAVTTPKKVDASVPAIAASLDMKAIFEEVDAEIGGRKYKDAPGTDGSSAEITGAQAFADYGQIAEPLRDRQNLILEKMAARLEAMVKPALEAAASREQESHQSAVQETIAAATDAGVPDAAELFADPRMREFIANNPQYQGMFVADPDRAEDVAFVFNKFRAFVGIAKPAASPAKPKPVVAAPARPRSILAATSTARGSGAREENGSVSGTPEQIYNSEFERLRQRQAENERVAGGI